MRPHLFRIEGLACFILSYQTHHWISLLWNILGFVAMAMSFFGRDEYR